MQVRAITRKGTKLEAKQLTQLRNDLAKAIAKAGFETTVSVINSSRIDIKGGHSGVSNKYATVNVAKRGYNYRVNSFTAVHCKVGYKRTNVLSWDDRVELNHLINDILDKQKISAQVEARGGFVIRNKQAKGGVGTMYVAAGRVNQWDVPFESNIGDSFQPNFHDWIYNSEPEAVEAVRLAYGKSFEEGCDVRTVGEYEFTSAAGVHLIDPDENELARGIEDAESKGFGTVWVHRPSLRFVRGGK